MDKIFLSVIVLIASITIYLYFCYFNTKNKRVPSLSSLKSFSGSIAFFHPFCNDCGGGERVLWAMVSLLQSHFPKVLIKIYSCEKASPEDIINKAKDRFNLSVDGKRIEFVQLNGKKWIMPSSWPRFTLFGQSIGGIILAVEAARKFVPDILIDTTGCVFFGVIMRLAGCKSIGAYIHYPTISTDMIKRVRNREKHITNSELISKNFLYTTLKLIYYNIFAFWYGLAGKTIHYAVTNSKWTLDHINELWNLNNSRVSIVYPPCSPHFFDGTNSKRTRTILSLSQFRPEKEHKNQLGVFAEFLHMSSDFNDVQFIMAGSVRSKNDEEYLESVKNYASELNITEKVKFVINAPLSELQKLMSNSQVGIHSMKQEHFGICLVEMMASGLIVIAHDSGGPRTDIIVDYNNSKVGFLAKTPQEYSLILRRIFNMEENVELIRSNAISSVHARFSDEKFNQGIITTIEKLIIAVF